LIGKPEGNRPLGRPRCRWEDNKFYLQEFGWREWSGLIFFSYRDRWLVLVNAVINTSSLKFRTGLD